MKLSELIGQDGQIDARFAAREITGIAADSRKVKPGYLFVAVPGTKSDGLSFVPQALAAGAAAILAERTPDKLPDDVAFVQTTNARRTLALAAARFYRAPAGNHRGGDRHQRQDLRRGVHAADLGRART